MMAMQAGGHQPSVVIQQVATTSGTEGSNQARRQPGTCMGTTLVVFGGIDIIIGLFYLIYQVARLSRGTAIYSGVWGGLFVIGTGCVAIAAGRTRLKGPIIAVLVMSIISILLAGIIIPSILTADAVVTAIDSSTGFTSTYNYAADAAVIIPILGVLGFACFLTTSILSCVALCATDCCNENPRRQTPSTQMVMVSPDGKFVPVQVVNVSGTQQVVPAGSDYTSLHWRNGQQNTPAQPSAPPPPYTLNPEPFPNHVHGAAARESTTSNIYCEIMDSAPDSGDYLHPPPLQDEDGYEQPIMKTSIQPNEEDGYEVMTGGGQVPGRDEKSEGVKPRPQHPTPPPTVDEAPYADVQYQD